ncbi:hypothetical protein BN3661_01640 [Eubacteriaceae bacterium CHKCI005]|nr:hypothetical protein BN3661_01640 [Eubacteriaceae bacterium CHKCI005]
MAIAILFTIGCVGTGVMLVDDRTASMAMGDEDRTTAPAISQEGLATGRILGREYTFPVPSREQMTEMGEQALNVIPPEIRLGAAGIGHVSQWIADAVQAALQWITGET